MATPIILRTSGIYVIVNVKNGKVYVGKTAMGFSKRWNAHRNNLRNNTHSNCHLQRAWNVDGEKKFKFLVLEYCPTEQLDEREKHHIAIYKERKLAYNMTNGGEGMTGYITSLETRALQSDIARNRPPASEKTRRRISEANKGSKRTPEQCRNISIALKGKKKPSPNTETIAKMSESHKGDKNVMFGRAHSEETRAKISKTKGKFWIVTKPNGENIKISNLEGFCRENNLCSSTMRGISYGKQTQYKGWKCQKVDN